MLLAFVRSRIGREWNELEVGDLVPFTMNVGDPIDLVRDRAAKLADLRTIVEKVEKKAHVPADNPDVVALKNIVEHRIEQLEQLDQKNGL